MSRYRLHWIALLAVVVGSFAVLGGLGPRIASGAPPVPTRVVTADGRTLVDGEAILRGQNVWQSLGGQELGSVWGHGAYVAPDWTADWLHREALSMLDRWARAEGVGSHDALPPERQAALRERLTARLHKNTYDPATRRPSPSGPSARRRSRRTCAHYADVFTNGRDAYAIPAGALTDPAKLARPGRVLLLDELGGGDLPPRRGRHLHAELAARAARREPPHRRRRRLERGRQLRAPARGHRRARVVPRPARRARRRSSRTRRATRSSGSPRRRERATVKYFWVVAALLVVQIALGAVTAHYGVEGSGFYGIPLAECAAVLGVAHLARPARDLLDRDRLARDRALRRPGGVRRASRAASARREPPLRRAARHRGRLARGAVALGAAAALRGRVVLVRAPGLRVRRPRPVLADLLLLVGLFLWLVPHAPRALARARGARASQRAAPALFVLSSRGHRALLRRGAR